MTMNYAEKRREVDLIEYWRVIVRRKWVIMTFACTLIFFVGVFSFLATPKYKSTTTLLIEEESSRVLSIDDTFGYQPGVFRDMRFYNTQLKLLESESLAERVARKMNLLSRPEFGAGENSEKGLIASAKDLLSFKWITAQKKSKDKNSEFLIPSDPYSEVAKKVQGNIKVRPVRDTKLVEVSFTSSSPILATEVVNTLAVEFINFSIEKRYETTQQASDFLSEQIANLRDDLAAKERELQKYGQEKELFFLSDTESTAVSKFADLNKAYTQAQIDRIRTEAAYLELKSLKADSLPQFVNNPVIQQLKTEYTRIKNEYEEKSKKFKPSYPEMITLKAKLDSMWNELKKAVDAAESEYRSALKKEVSLKNLLRRQRADVVRMESNAILYNSIKIEVENKRRLLNSLVERQNETLVSARLGGLKTSNISIIDKAKVPKNPVSPKKKLNLFLALLVGLFGGVGLCFFFEYLDNTVKGPEDVEKLAGLPSLGVIPYLSPKGVKKKKRYGHYSLYKYSYGKENPGSEDTLPEIKEIELVNHLYPKFFISEDYRTVRTSILLSHAESPPKTIVFSSTLPKEGKTATVVNMAVAFSQLEEKVLIIDADLRKPRLHRIFKVRNLGGLSGYLTGKVSLKDAIQKTSVENIWLLPSGVIPPNPAELLNSKKMKKMMEEVKGAFDVILLDTAPVLAVIDAVIVSSLADSVVFLIKAGDVARKPFLNAVGELRGAKAKIIGVLFNELKLRRGDYHFMDYYRYYRHGYYREEEK
ncbi:MAG: polysaccharide biosynthesis tyrosine autokinase [Candidatus Aminicenantes bacterium]|nr:polysaccharide biosynthesis tyrosine autokinase [Candidatus Aminicenantes bacterium]